MAGVSSSLNQARRVYRLTERTVDKHGKTLLLPEYVLDGLTTKLRERFNFEEVVTLYWDHATHEQFHWEFKSDMGLERLPSCQFETNYLVCKLVAVEMNLLRLIAQNTLNKPDPPVHHLAKRRRIKTVMQEFMFKATRMITHAGQWALGLGVSDPTFAVFELQYAQLVIV